MKCFLTHTGAFLPGAPVDNQSMHRFIGCIDGEDRVKRQVLSVNGIQTRHYATDENQNATHSVYEMATLAGLDCLAGLETPVPIGYLSAGSTYTPLAAPGISSILHGELSQHALVDRSLEVNSNAGICSSAVTSVINARRAICLGEHQAALCIGAEHASEILKSSKIQLPPSHAIQSEDVKRSPWFMSVFLRFMLSDGAGAWLLQSRPDPSRMSFQMDWTFSRSFAHEAPLCMKLDNETALLSQEVDTLSKYLFVCAEQATREMLEHQNESLAHYRMVLPHLSSFFFQRRMQRLLRKFSDGGQTTEHWTNLATAGNTGSAAIFLMLHEFTAKHAIRHGDRFLLFVPESGQFNFVFISLTAVGPDGNAEG